MTANLSGKVALVTGASRGVGKGAALGLAEAGATVYITGRTLEAGQSQYSGSLLETVAQINQLGGQGHAKPCDHRDDDAVKAVIDEIIAAEGKLDVLVNNVFVLDNDIELWSEANFWEQPISMWDDQIDIGLRSHYVACVYAVPHMIKAGAGLIVNISSSGAEEYHYNVAYGAGKAGLDKMSRDMSTELESSGVSVISLWPGLVGTERITDQLGADGLASMGFETPLFTGRAVAALTADSRLEDKRGTRHRVCDLAVEYGFTDIDGTIPNAHTYLDSEDS